MRTLIVLGLIPGTKVYISFDEWLAVLDVLVGLIWIYKIERKHRSISRSIAKIRLPLPASRLHSGHNRLAVKF